MCLQSQVLLSCYMLTDTGKTDLQGTQSPGQVLQNEETAISGSGSQYLVSGSGSITDGSPLTVETIPFRRNHGSTNTTFYPHLHQYTHIPLWNMSSIDGVGAYTNTSHSSEVKTKSKVFKNNISVVSPTMVFDQSLADQVLQSSKYLSHNSPFKDTTIFEVVTRPSLTKSKILTTVDFFGSDKESYTTILKGM